jgi:hypothetical protein
LFIDLTECRFWWYTVLFRSCAMDSMKLWDGYLQYKRDMYVGKQGIQIDDDAFEKYVTENGVEKASGYLEAMNDFVAQIDVILGGGYCRDGIPNSGHIVRKHLRELVDHDKKFVDKHIGKTGVHFKP